MGWTALVVGLVIIGAWVYFATHTFETANKEIICDMKNAQTNQYECKPSFLGAPN